MEPDALSIVLPVFNEAAVIEQVISGIAAYAASRHIQIEIIAVNDGSTDTTSMVLGQISRSLSNVRVVLHAKNGGYGAALRSGIKAAQYPWVLLMDSDGQMHIDSLQAAWPHRNDNDLLLGYRRQRADSFYRRVLGKSGNTVSNLFLGRQVRDINCGFKLFKKDLIQSLTLSSSGGIINFEILYQLFRKNSLLRLYQFPVEHFPRQLGKSTGGNPKVIGKIMIEGFKVLFGVK